MSQSATGRRRQLGRLLRRARENAALTQAEAAAKLRCGQAKINKIETSLVAVSLSDLTKLIDLYQIAAAHADELRKLTELDQHDGPERTRLSGPLSAFGELTNVEAEAREIRCWHSERLPGPLQSEMYVLTMHAPLFATNKAEVTRVIREWTARKGVFTAPNPPSYKVIISESALRRMPGGGSATALRVDQSEYLLKLMDEYEQLDLRVLTFDAEVAYVDSDFQHLMFRDDQHCEFFYVEYPGGSRKCKTPRELDDCREQWAALRAAALGPAESREFLTRFTTGTELS
ncbi:MAG TPA: DUF5753 domain-containing protein [Microlunatus sp.]|nr:DUF5753 domain-containing protein [Microlunatus sp.]